METLHLILLHVLCLRLISLIDSSTTCDERLSITGPKMMAMMNRTYPSCEGTDLTFHSPVCELSEDDRSDTCSSSADRLPRLPACPDGSWNRICYPVPSNGATYHMNCVCRSFVKISDDVRNANWLSTEALNTPVDGASYTRRLLMDGGECITQEFIRAGQPIISGYDLPTSVYTGSSAYTSNLVPYKARIDQYFTASKCGWAHDDTDNDKWLGITLPTEYTIQGCVINRRCDINRYITVVTVTTSYDDNTWQNVTVTEDLSEGYNAERAAYIFFPASYTSRYWKFFVIEASIVRPRVKLDLLGTPL